jgi:hypothetical protein
VRRLLSPRRGLAGAFTVVAVAADLWFAPVAASAAPADVICTGQEAVNYSPGLTSAPRDTTVTINGLLGSAGNPGLCVALGKRITSATYREVFNRPSASCVQALFNGPGSRVIVWGDGRSSIFTFSAQIQTLPVASLVTLTGTITSGEFTDRRAVETIQIPQLDPLQCSTTGIVNSIALATLVIL